MTKGKQQIQTHFDKLTVKINHGLPGTGVFDTTCLVLGVAYRVLATYLRYDGMSGGYIPVFLIKGAGGVIVEKACSRFLVAKVS